MQMPLDASVPPKEGEYAYYNSTFSTKTHWLVKTNSRKDGEFCCHYSQRNEQHGIPFVACNGLIQAVGKCIPTWRDAWNN